jgi:hypothetical protein
MFSRFLIITGYNYFNENSTRNFPVFNPILGEIPVFWDGEFVYSPVNSEIKMIQPGIGGGYFYG